MEELTYQPSKAYLLSNWRALRAHRLYDVYRRISDRNRRYMSRSLLSNSQQERDFCKKMMSKTFRWELLIQKEYLKVEKSYPTR